LTTVTTTTQPAAPVVPKNGATPVTPQPPAEPVDKLKALEAKEAEVKAREAGLTKKERIYQLERLKEAKEREGAKKSLGEKLSKLAQYEKEEREWGINPEPLLKRRLGDNYFDKLNELRVNGGAPTAQTLASELDARDERILQKIEERERTARESAEKEKNDSLTSARQLVEQDATDFLDTSWDEFPVFKTYGKPGVAKAIAQYIEGEFTKSGKMLTAKDAAEAIEKAEISRLQEVAKIEKYKSALTPSEKAAQTVPVANGSTPLSRTKSVSGRTLSNDLTASTPGRTPARTDDERRERAIAAIQAVKASRPV
jgi:hypothetical protein